MQNAARPGQRHRCPRLFIQQRNIPFKIRPIVFHSEALERLKLWVRQRLIHRAPRQLGLLILLEDDSERGQLR